ncbi:Uncharacterized protein BP5553_09297 [Venustampulla echinocandica]|uniref:XPG-I domain-containing protein n=1 Tax=Venustampulla echinocandica TaxID=2656787 RepID=A0A370TCD0_9HELO|nr:Uncharacterized protein BP5553_09297 [Venustampulla echinocandica]RDL31895.1 Uncharacterized protein BP5553_09297 [Venustampulla echinocandica]
MHRVRMLRHFGVIPYIVFDGDYLPSKAATEKDRANRREESRRRGMELLNAGKPSQAYLEFQKAIDVTPEMARQLIDELKETGVQYVVAPYEADAQMVYLERKGIVQGIISEDSDLLVFGAKCLLTKLDQYGNCIEINKADFCACKEITLTGWTDKEFRQMAILSGCDYLASINNMGLKTAYRMVRKHKTIEKVLRMLQFDGKFHVPKGYLEAFHQAELTFLHQRVFCPKTRTLVLHTEPQHPINESELSFIGGYVEPKIAQGVARGDLNPMTKEPIVVQGLGKKNKMAVATPPPSRFHHHGSASSNDLKKGKPISSFFMAQRIPLGELDPNCFTPSPSQQDALHRNSGPWMAGSAPRPYLSRPTTEPEQPPRSAPPARTQPGRRLSRTSINSEPRPPKRARLCAEDAEISAIPKVELGRSPFFAFAASEPSPTVNRVRKSNRSKKGDITIFSDDSIEEAMLDLPDADGFKSQGLGSHSKLGIFREDDIVHDGAKAKPDGSPDSPTPGRDSESQDTTPSLTCATSAPSSAEEPSTPKDAVFAVPPVKGLREKFAFTADGSSTPKSTIPSHSTPEPTPPISTRPSKIPIPVKARISVPKTSPSSNRAKLTPLQRLGASVMNRSNLPMTPPHTPSLKSNHRRGSLLGKGSMTFPEVQQENQSSTVDPAMIPLPAIDEMEKVTLAMQSGSEDWIVHDSEEEDDDMSRAEEHESPRRMNLAQFVYTN